MLETFAKFMEGLLHYGLEKYGRFYGAYRGEVVSNEDPENLGRLQVSCSALYGSEKPDEWAWPRGNMAGAGYGVFWIPQPGDPIYVSCINGDPRFPLWEYGWWTSDSIPAGAKPKVYVFLTPDGNRIELNDDAGFIQIIQKNGFNIKIFPDGMYIGKGNNNLGKYLDDVMQQIVTMTIPTIYGASPPNNLAQFVELKAKLPLFLKTSE